MLFEREVERLAMLWHFGQVVMLQIRRPSGVLDESEVKPPFFPPFRPPKKRAPESPQRGGGARILFFMEDAEPARSGVDAAWGRIPPCVGTLYTRFSLPKPVAAPYPPPSVA